MSKIRSMPNPFPGIYNPAKTQVSTTVKPKLPKINKVGKNGSLIAIVLDESGSMSSCWNPTVEGYNQFLNEQKKLDAERTKVTLCKFEGGNTKYPYQYLSILEAPLLDRTNYIPGGGTNLLDAIGKTIIETNDYLKGLPEEERPAVIITIMTDGEENSSRQFTNEDIKVFVKKCEKKGWAFTFLGANIDAFAVGATFGMNASNTASYSTANMGATMATMSNVTTRMRSAKLAGVDTETVYASAMYTNAERNEIKGK